MIWGIGVDLVHLDRFERFTRDHAARLPEMFTEGERRRPAFLAEAFALKEAALKAIGGLTGWELDWREIEAGAAGRVRLSGSVARHARRLGVARVHGSAMREAGAVIATAIAETARRDKKRR